MQFGCLPKVILEFHSVCQIQIGLLLNRQGPRKRILYHKNECTFQKTNGKNSKGTTKITQQRFTCSSGESKLTLVLAKKKCN